MKPILVLQHLDADGPAYLARWLERAGLPYQVFNTEAGQAYPASVEGWGALAVLGGEMGANDPLPSLRDAERLILDAVERGRPVLGHCLGGQLMARALGGRVAEAEVPEIGWHVVERLPLPEAAYWFGEGPRSTLFQWHYDSFDLPPDAQLLARSEACPCQAFGIGPHLAMQFHVELDEAKLLAWTAAHDPRHLAKDRLPTVQGAAQMRQDAVRFLAAQQRLADRIYARWTGLAARAA